MTAASVTAAGRSGAKAPATLTPPEKAAAGPMSAQAEHDTVPCAILRMSMETAYCKSIKI